MIRNYKNGDTVWFENPWKDAEVISGVIRGVEQATLSVNPLRVHTDIIVEYFATSGPQQNTMMKTVKSPVFLFATQEECIRQMKIDTGEIDIRDVYRDEIRSVKDLMRFIFTQAIDKKQGNPAYEVALEKTIKLMGYDNLIPYAIEV